MHFPLSADNHSYMCINIYFGIYRRIANRGFSLVPPLKPLIAITYGPDGISKLVYSYIKSAIYRNV